MTATAKLTRVFDLITRDGPRSVTTDLTDQEAAQTVFQHCKNSEFGQDLVRQFQKRGLSPKQLAWLHLIAFDARERLREQERKAAQIANEIAPLTKDGEESFAAIPALFAKGGKKLKYPKIRLALIENGEVGRQYILFVMGDRSRAPGSIMVCEQREDRSGEKIGRIAADGIWVPFAVGVEQRHPGLIDLLRRFAGDPAGVTAELGRLIGRCCYCGLKLEDERSTEMGYGPRCAEVWSLNWGTKVRQRVALEV